MEKYVEKPGQKSFARLRIHLSLNKRLPELCDRFSKVSLFYFDMSMSTDVNHSIIVLRSTLFWVLNISYRIVLF